MSDAVGNGARALRSTTRMEMQPHELATASRLLAGLPRREDQVDPALRLAAAGSELVYQLAYLRHMRELVREGELPMGSAEEERLLDAIVKATGELVTRLEEHLGAFPADDDEPWREHGLRETFLIDVAPDRQADARWLVEFTRRASDASEPVELVGRMMLRAVGEDLREVEGFLCDLTSGLGAGDLRDLAAEVTAGCAELATAIAETLPPAPSAETRSDDGGTEVSR